MGFEILGSDGVTVLKVDTTSQAARTTLYDQYDNPMSDVNSLGNILNGLNAATTLTLGGQSTVGVNVAGTTGTLTLAFEATIDNSTWFAVTMTPATGGATVTTTSADGQWVGSVSGYYAFRIRISAFTSGSMDVGVVITPGQSKTGAQAITTVGALTVEISDGTNGPANVTPPSTAATAAEEALVVALSPNSPLPTGSNIIGSLSANQSVNLAEINGTTTVTGGEAGSIGIGGLAATGSAVTGNPVLVAGTDGTYVRSILTDSSGRQEVVGGAASGSPVAGNPVLIAGSDGTDARTLSTDASGHPIVVGDGTAGSPAGGVVSVQGVSGGTAVPVSFSGTTTVVGDAASGSPVAGNPVLIGGSDGTDARTISTDASGHPVIVGDGTAGSPAGGVVSVQGVSGGQSLPISGSVTASGTVTANQGTPNTVANSWTTEITDGTHGPAAVKAASTAAAAADLSLVVALSPNSPVPSGSNVIGAVTQSGAWSATVTQATPSNLQAEIGGLAAAGSAPVGNPVQIGGSDGTDIRTLLTDASGRQEVVGAAASGSAVVGNPVLVGGSDGTDARTLLTDTSGRPIVVGEGTAGTPAGGVVSVQGVSGGQALPVSFSGTTTVVGDAASGSPVAGNPVLIGGSDGTDARTMATDASGHPVIVGDGTAGSPAGGVVSVQGVSSGQALPVSLSGTVTVVGDAASGSPVAGNPVLVAGSDGTDARSILTDTSGRPVVNQGVAAALSSAWSAKITDGTNGPAAVKAASTQSAAADPALVVALSPGSAQTRASTGTTTGVASSASSVTILAANSARLGAIITNSSTAILYLRYSATAAAISSGNYTVSVAITLGTHEVPFGYTGAITGIWASANGFANVTEITV